MVCGVKYCGGCNPRFDRSKFLVRLKKACDDIEFVYVQQDTVYDHLVVINGCPSKCANIQEIQVTGDTFKIAEESQLELLITQLKER